MKLAFDFPQVLVSPDLSVDKEGVLFVMPYIKERPLATAVPLPPAVTAQMALGAEVQMHLDGRSFYLVPLNAARKIEPELALAQAVANLVHTGCNEIAIAASGQQDMDVQLLAAYLTDLCRHHFSMKTKEKAPLACTVHLLVDEKFASDLHKGVALGKARAFMRTIIDMPANVATPQGIVFFTKQFLEQQGLTSTIAVQARHRVDEDVSRMGAFLGVAQGSAQEPVFLELAYGLKTNDRTSTADINFVGKGVTFDTGGISIKPSNNMHHMKGDMGGAASAIAALLYAAMAGLPLKLRAFMPFCENMPSSNALKPGDVVRAYDGTTIEIIDTDAEGRLILADALAFANNFPASTTINMATLTGACRMALGGAYAGLFSDNDKLCEEVSAAGIAGKDKVWRLPMTDDYLYMLKSKVADVSHLDRTNGGGTINGAFFLKYFVKQKDRWVHLDIANVSADKACATGRPLSLLAKLLDKRSAG